LRIAPSTTNYLLPHRRSLGAWSLILTGSGLKIARLA